VSTGNREAADGIKLMIELAIVVQEDLEDDGPDTDVI
jgi:hypothetical protein